MCNWLQTSVIEIELLEPVPLVLSWLLQARISLPKIKIVEIITNWTFVEVVVGNYYNGRAL